jgi:hypothetical protein
MRGMVAAILREWGILLTAICIIFGGFYALSIPPSTKTETSVISEASAPAPTQSSPAQAPRPPLQRARQRQAIPRRQPLTPHT